MARCLEIAKNGLGTTYPNPLVGSVIVVAGQIIGEGWHQKAGEAHAEVNAIASVKDKTQLKNATLYVNLEPCNHFGRTPPCSDLILQHKIPRVVIGAVDSNELVHGSGIKKLQDSGIEVTVGVLEKECLELNKRFYTFHTKKRPYLILKWAQSADKFLSPESKPDKVPVWLTNPLSRQLVHKWRSEEAAILVGSQTVLEDNPELTARDWNGNNPLRIVIDRQKRTASESAVYNDKAKTFVFAEASASNENFTEFVVAEMHRQQIQSVIVEGGRKTLQYFIDANLWDEARVFNSEIQLVRGTKAPDFNGIPMERTKILNDELLIFKNGN